MPGAQAPAVSWAVAKRLPLYSVFYTRFVHSAVSWVVAKDLYQNNLHILLVFSSDYNVQKSLT